MLLRKLNTLQIHLTDGQGWRIESKAFLSLVSTGALGVGNQPQNVRRYPRDETQPRGRYYCTPAELKDLVAYVADRGVTIVPEIEMPGHTGALLRSCPELLCPGSDEIKPGTWWSVRVLQPRALRSIESKVDAAHLSLAARGGLSRHCAA